MNESIIQSFADWARLKLRIHLYKNLDSVYFRERQIWWASVGQNIGVESNGKNANFERPVLKHLAKHWPLEYRLHIEDEERDSAPSHRRAAGPRP